MNRRNFLACVAQAVTAMAVAPLVPLLPKAKPLSFSPAEMSCQPVGYLCGFPIYITDRLPMDFKKYMQEWYWGITDQQYQDWFRLGKITLQYDPKPEVQPLKDAFANVTKELGVQP